MTVHGERHVLAALLAAVCCASSTAFAATPVFVDGSSPTCHGKGTMGVNCFATIQDGVDNAGPPPAVVNVFPGTYLEDVDLATMGSAIGGMQGDITLQTVNNAGTPTPGTVSVKGVQAAIGNAGVFTGDVTIVGFKLTSQMSAGTLLSVMGAIVISHVEATEADADGIFATGSSGVDIEESTASKNGGIGFDLSSSGPITLHHIVANSNQGSGINASTASTLSVDDAIVGGNQNGADLSSGGGITVRTILANSNTGSGVNASTAGVVDIQWASASDNAVDGLALSAGMGVTLRDAQVDRNQGSGVDVSTGASILLERVSANDNGIFGFNLSSGAGATAHTVWGNRNGSEGIRVSTNGPVEIVDAGASDNGSNGINVSSGAAQTIRRAVADRNGADGVMTSTGSAVTLEEISASGNMGGGFDVSSGNMVTGTALRAADNGGIGFSYSGLLGLTLTGSELLRNVTGLRLQGPMSASFEVHCNSIDDNPTAGLDSGTPASTDAENNWWGSANGPEHPGNPGGTGNKVVDGANGGMGTVDYTPFLFGPAKNNAACGGKTAPAPVMSGWALIACGVALLALGCGVLTRRPLPRI